MSNGRREPLPPPCISLFSSLRHSFAPRHGQMNVTSAPAHHPIWPPHSLAGGRARAQTDSSTLHNPAARPAPLGSQQNPPDLSLLICAAATQLVRGAH